MALSDAAVGCDGPAMAVYVWQQDMAPEFPLAVLEYTVRGDADRMHWHDHFEIALVQEGRGASCSAGAASRRRPGDIFFIDNSQPHVALADPGTPLRLLLVLFRPELIAGPGCRELDLGYLAPFRVDERTWSPRVCGTIAARRPGRAGPARAARHPRAPRPRGAPPRSTPRCARPWRW